MKKTTFLLSALLWPALAYSSVTLTHQYTFDDLTVDDQVGNANGVATVSGGEGSFLEAPGFTSNTPNGVGSALSVGLNQGTLKSGFTLDKNVITSAAGSISLWANAADNGVARWLLNDVYNTGVGIQIPNNTVLRIRGAVGGTVSAPTLWTANTWNHIVLTWNNDFDGFGGNQGLFYFNGVQIGTFGYAAEVNPDAETTGLQFYIGGFNLQDSNVNLANQFKGYLDNIQLYSGVLDASEVTYLYQNPGLAVIPEPSTVGLAAIGLAFAIYRRRRAR